MRACVETLADLANLSSCPLPYQENLTLQHSLPGTPRSKDHKTVMTVDMQPQRSPELY